MVNVEHICDLHEGLAWRSLTPLRLLSQVLAAGLTFFERMVLFQVAWYFLFDTLLEYLLLDGLKILELRDITRAA